MAKSRRSARPSKPEESQSVITMPVIVGVIAVALLITGGLIALGTWDQTNDQAVGASVDLSEIDESTFPTKGDPNAPVTLIDFSDYG